MFSKCKCPNIQVGDTMLQQMQHISNIAINSGDTVTFTEDPYGNATFVSNPNRNYYKSKSQLYIG